jgi:hypothetical protein
MPSDRIPQQVLLGPATLMDTGTATSTSAYRLIDSGADNWDILLLPWDLVINTSANPQTKAYVQEIIDPDTLRLSKDIFTATGNYRIVRGSFEQLILPEGKTLHTLAVHAQESRGSNVQGLEVHRFDHFSKRRDVIAEMDSNGLLKIWGATMFSNWASGLFIVNYMETNVVVTLDHIDVSASVI